MLRNDGGDSSRVMGLLGRTMGRRLWDCGLVAAAVLVVSLCCEHAAWPFKENLGLLYKGHIYYGDTLYTKYL